MDKHTVMKILKVHQAELQDLGVDHLALFGSVARGEAGPDSDVDLLATFNKAKSFIALESCRYSTENFRDARVSGGSWKCDCCEATP